MEVEAKNDSILIPLREAQLSAKSRKQEVAEAILDPKEWLVLARELAEEGTRVTADEASSLALSIDGTAVTVQFVTGHERQLFRAAFIIRTQYGQVCPDFKTCKHDACQASSGAWMTADEALSIYR